jgi:hypothetical protein
VEINCYNIFVFIPFLTDRNKSVLLCGERNVTGPGTDSERKAFDDSIANGGILWVMGDAPCSRNHQMTLLFE